MAAKLIQSEGAFFMFRHHQSARCTHATHLPTPCQGGVYGDARGHGHWGSYRSRWRDGPLRRLCLTASRQRGKDHQRQPPAIYPLTQLHANFSKKNSAFRRYFLQQPGSRCCRKFPFASDASAAYIRKYYLYAPRTVCTAPKAGAEITV